MLDTVMNILAAHDMCVLATTGPKGPHTSLMGYVWDEEQLRIYLMLRKGSLKYGNMCSDPRVSLLVDDRIRHAENPHEGTQALTVHGVHVPFREDGDKQRAQGMLLRRLPHLIPFASQKDTTPVAIQPQGFQWLRDVEDAVFLKIP